MNAKKLWWILSSIAMAGILAGTVWWFMRPPSIMLSSGARLTVLGVTYGHRHSAPRSTGLTGKRNRSGMFNGTNDFLVVWLKYQHRPNQWANFQLYVYDEKGVACVGQSGMTYMGNGRDNGNTILAYRLDAFPRRQGKFKLRLQEWNQENGRQTFRDAFTVHNPARGPFPSWSPEALPVAHSDGDVEVTLNSISPGAKMQYQRNDENPTDAMNRGVQVDMEIHQAGNLATNWDAVEVTTSDATGNTVNGWVNHIFNGTDDKTLYQWGLWPDEPAWKVRFELSRHAGFHEDELWAVQNLPLVDDQMQSFWNNNRNRKTPAFAETKLNGVNIRIFPAKKFTDQPAGGGGIEGGIVIQTQPAPAGMRMTIVNVTDDHGRALTPMMWGGGDDDHRFGLRDLGDAKSLNVTIAYHKSRFVEFVVKPKS